MSVVGRLQTDSRIGRHPSSYRVVAPEAGLNMPRSLRQTGRSAPLTIRRSSTWASLIGPLLGLATVVSLSGCVHNLEVKNLEAIAVTPTRGIVLDVAVSSPTGNEDQRQYVQHVVAALRLHPRVRLLRENWTPERRDASFYPSHLVTVTVSPRYKGSLWNLPISLPGVIVFTHTWHGFVYYADVRTRITAAPTDSAYRTCPAVGPRDETVENRFSMRHCAWDRGVTQGVAFSVFVGSLGAGFWIPTATGLAFIWYDKDATKELHARIDEAYGRYVAEDIVQMLCDAGAEEYARRRPPLGRPTRPSVPVAAHPPSPRADPARPRRKMTADPRNGEYYALLVGIEEYRDENIGDLSYSIDDVSALRECLLRGGMFRAGNVFLMTDSAASEADIPTKLNILRTLQWLTENLRPEDTLFFAFAGAPAILQL